MFPEREICRLAHERGHCAGYPTTRFDNGTFITVKPSLDVATAAAIRCGRCLAVGTTVDVRSMDDMLTVRDKVIRDIVATSNR